MNKKMVSAMLGVGMVMSMLTGGSISAAAANDGDVETITIYTPFVGNNDDQQLVVDAINEIASEEIGVEINWQQFNIGQWFQQYSLFLSGTDEIDILFNFGGISNGVGQGAFMELDDLVEEYGQGIAEILGDYLVCGEVNGQLYGLIPYNLYASYYGIAYRADIVSELGLEEEVAAVETLSDWGAILEAVKEAYPGITPYVTGTGTSMSNFYYGDWDSLSDSMGVLMNCGESTEVVDLFETDEYAELCSVMSDWYDAGLTSKDIQTVTDSYSTLCAQGVAFSTVTSMDATTAYDMTNSTGYEIKTIQLGESFASTYTDGLYAIMANSEHAEAAMKFLNLMYTDSRILNLMSYGIEGIHYQVLEDGTLDYLDGQDSSSCTYHDELGACANMALRSEWQGDYPNLGELIEEDNATCKKSAALGFVFDSTPVVNQTTEVDNVLTKYRIGIESGSMNAEETLPVFIEELKTAGIDEVIAEKQSQLDEWLSGNQSE
ncbi:MAG: ABC transporter substrate-binding protein [Lachnospiraceae bacterium]|nr:ABC transporter substrate-binding protein [Lachnospiraceae bacterium]